MEGDGLRIFLLVQKTGVELAGKVELIITLTWETYYIRYSSSQRNVILIFVIIGIIRISIPSVSPVFIGIDKEGIGEQVFPFCRICGFRNEESLCSTRSLESGCLCSFIHTGQATQPVLMMQILLLSIEMRNLTIE